MSIKVSNYEKCVLKRFSERLSLSLLTTLLELPKLRSLGSRDH